MSPPIQAKRRIILIYKDYIGKAIFDKENNVFSGKIINTRTVITFQCDSVVVLDAEIKASVDDYLKWCK